MNTYSVSKALKKNSEQRGRSKCASVCIDFVGQEGIRRLGLILKGLTIPKSMHTDAHLQRLKHPCIIRVNDKTTPKGITQIRF